MDIWKYNNLLREYQSDYINKDTDTDTAISIYKKEILDDPEDFDPEDFKQYYYGHFNSIEEFINKFMKDYLYSDSIKNEDDIIESIRPLGLTYEECDDVFNFDILGKYLYQKAQEKGIESIREEVVKETEKVIKVLLDVFNYYADFDVTKTYVLKSKGKNDSIVFERDNDMDVIIPLLIKYSNKETLSRAKYKDIALSVLCYKVVVQYVPLADALIEFQKEAPVKYKFINYDTFLEILSDSWTYINGYVFWRA